MPAQNGPLSTEEPQSPKGLNSTANTLFPRRSHAAIERGVAKAIGADWVVYQELDALVDAVRSVNPKLTEFDTSCFSGEYVCGPLSERYFAKLHAKRNDGAKKVPLTPGKVPAPNREGDVRFEPASPINFGGKKAQPPTPPARKFA